MNREPDGRTDNMENINTNDRKIGYICIAVTTILFSSMETVLKLVAGDFNPVQMTLIRFFIGGLVLFPFALNTLRKKRLAVTPGYLGKFAFLGFVGIFLSMNLYQLAITYTEASVVAVIFSCNPLFVTIFAGLFLKEVIESKNILAIALEIIGIVIIIQPWNTKLSVTGVILTILATVAFALYGVLGKRDSAKFGGVVTTCFSFLCASVEMILLAAVSRIPAVSGFLTDAGLDKFSSIPLFTGFSMDNILVVLYVGIGVTGVGYACYFIAMEKVKAQTVNLVFFFKPILAPVFALAVLHEVIPFNMIMGIVVLLAGSFVSLFGDRVKLFDRNVSNS